jgi:hypothetical protein
LFNVLQYCKGAKVVAIYVLRLLVPPAIVVGVVGVVFGGGFRRKKYNWFLGGDETRVLKS